MPKRPFDLVVCDLVLSDGDGASSPEEAERLGPGARRVLVSALEPPPSGGQEAVDTRVGETPAIALTIDCLRAVPARPCAPPPWGERFARLAPRRAR